MKRTNLLAKAGLLFAASATLLFASCDNGNDDDGGDNGSKKLQLTVNLTAPTGYEASQLPAMIRDGHEFRQGTDLYRNH